MAECDSIEDVVGKIIDVRFESIRDKENIEKANSSTARLIIREEKSSDTIDVMFPFESRNLLDPILVGSALVGEDVHYTKETSVYNQRLGHYSAPRSETCWTLEMLSGKMKGHAYQMRKENKY